MLNHIKTGFIATLLFLPLSSHAQSINNTMANPPRYSEQRARDDAYQNEMRANEMYYRQLQYEQQRQRMQYEQQRQQMELERLKAENRRLSLKEEKQQRLAAKEQSRKAFPSLLKKAQQGDAEAQFETGNMYYTGRGVMQDDGKALYWYKKAARQGHSRARKMLVEIIQ